MESKGFTEVLKGLVKLPPMVVIWLIMLQKRISDRWKENEKLVKFCDWTDRLTRGEIGITSEVFLYIPNLLCVARLTIIPFYLLWWVIGVNQWFYLVTYVFLMSLDGIDGAIARQTGTTSMLGKAIDPLADKISHLSVVIASVGLGIMPWWLIPVLLSKELILMCTSTHYKNSGSKWYGKVGTIVEIIVFTTAFFVPLPVGVFVVLAISQWLILLAYRLTD